MQYSEHHNLSPEAIVKKYLRQLNRSKIILIILGLIIVFAIFYMLFFSSLPSGTVFLTELVLLFLYFLYSRFIFRPRSVLRMHSLLQILVQDLDPEKYLLVMRELGKHDRFNRSANTLRLEQAAALYYLAEFETAFSVLKQIYFKRPHHPSYIRVKNVLALCALKLSNQPEYMDALQYLKNERDYCRKNKHYLSLIDQVIRILEICVKAPIDWTAEDIAFYENGIHNPKNQLSYINSHLQLARNAIARGDKQTAREHLTEVLKNKEHNLITMEAQYLIRTALLDETDNT